MSCSPSPGNLTFDNQQDFGDARPLEGANEAFMLEQGVQLQAKVLSITAPTMDNLPDSSICNCLRYHFNAAKHVVNNFCWMLLKNKCIQPKGLTVGSRIISYTERKIVRSVGNKVQSVKIQQCLILYETSVFDPRGLLLE
ncbi:hypothetical protein C8R48DRAFT_668914 [Suillus tomentosus]|nr:hypothetical protein C8R48DRAFT_668914 [Suillus tomentosus]